MILSLLNSDPHRCAFLDHLLLATKWVGVVGCGFGLTTLNELAPGLVWECKDGTVGSVHRDSGECPEECLRGEATTILKKCNFCILHPISFILIPNESPLQELSNGMLYSVHRPPIYGWSWSELITGYHTLT